MELPVKTKQNKPTNPLHGLERVLSDYKHLSSHGGACFVLSTHRWRITVHNTGAEDGQAAEV